MIILDFETLKEFKKEIASLSDDERKAIKQDLVKEARAIDTLLSGRIKVLSKSMTNPEGTLDEKLARQEAMRLEPILNTRQAIQQRLDIIDEFEK